MVSYEQVDFNKERKQILVYLTSSYGNTIIINLLMGGFESLSVVLLDNKPSILREVSTCPRGPKAVLFHLAQFLFEALVKHITYSYISKCYTCECLSVLLINTIIINLLMGGF
jgi:hypothetical protein